MPRLAGLAFVAAAFALAPGIASAVSPVVVRHDLAVLLEPGDGRLVGHDTLTVKAGGAPTLSLALPLTARVRSVTIGGLETPAALRDGTLDIALPAGGGNGEIRVAVEYEAGFQDPVPEEPVSTEDPGYGVRGTISSRGAFLSEEARWYPAPRGDGGEALFRVRVEAPDGFEAVTSGRLVRRATVGGRAISEWETERPLPGLSLSAGRYKVRDASAGEIPLYAFFFPEDEALAEKYLVAATRYLALYRELLAPYPFEKFAVVENFFPTGYGFPSWTLLGSSVVRLPFITETSLGHEIAHSWWGNGVRVDYSRGNWSEGLTTYVADYYYKERASAGEAREYRRKLLRDYATLVPPGQDFPLFAFTSRVDRASRAIGYGKAAMVFHMARKRVGDAAFWNALRRVIGEKLGLEASWDDFAKALSVESSLDMTPFFRQWVAREGAPVLALEGVEAKREPDGNGWAVTGRIAQREPFYDLRIPVRLVTGNDNIDVTVILAGREAALAVRSDAPPKQLVVDPDSDLFRRLDPAEIPPDVNGIKGSLSLAVVAARGLSAETLSACRVLLAGLGRDDAAVTREEDASPSSLAGRDVLYLGVPQGTGYLPKLPEGLSVAPARFAVEGTTYDAPGDALFAALPHPAGGGRVAALFLPLSPEAAKAAGRKVTHYGPSSWLVFSDGVNRGKGTWPPSASPLVRDFPQ